MGVGVWWGIEACFLLAGGGGNVGFRWVFALLTEKPGPLGRR
jgi:hypothetical protein